MPIRGFRAADERLLFDEHQWPRFRQSLSWRRSATPYAKSSSATRPVSGVEPARRTRCPASRSGDVDDPKSLAILDLLRRPSSTSASGISRPTSASAHSNAMSSTARASRTSRRRRRLSSRPENRAPARDPGSGAGAHDLHHRLARGHRAGDYDPATLRRRNAEARALMRQSKGARDFRSAASAVSKPPKPKSPGFSTGSVDRARQADRRRPDAPRDRHPGGPHDCARSRRFGSSSLCELLRPDRGRAPRERAVMTAIVFVGPTLRPEEIGRGGRFCLICRRSPRATSTARRGVARAPSASSTAISTRARVWHKEILWALPEGVPVFGSASMGALRAAELRGFGMRGVGRIFEAFREGALEDDDEVALAHGPAATGYPRGLGPDGQHPGDVRARRSERRRSAPDRSRRSKAFAKALFSRSQLAGVARGRRRHRRRRVRTGGPCGSGCRRDASTRSGWTGWRCSRRCGQTTGRRARVRGLSFRMDVFVGCVRRPIRNAALPQPSAKRIVLDELRLEGPEAYPRSRPKALLRLVAADRRRSADRAFSRQARATLERHSRAGRPLFAPRSRSLDGAQRSRSGVDGKLVEDQAGLEVLRDRSGRSIEPRFARRIALQRRLCAACRTGVEEGRGGRGVGSIGGTARRRLFGARRYGFGISKRLGRPPDDIADFAAPDRLCRRFGS